MTKVFDSHRSEMGSSPRAATPISHHIIVGEHQRASAIILLKATGVQCEEVLRYAVEATGHRRL